MAIGYYRHSADRIFFRNPIFLLEDPCDCISGIEQVEDSPSIVLLHLDL